MRELYTWQKKAIELFKDTRAFMLNVCCGGGKGCAATLVALHKKLPTIVIAPKNLCAETWPEELAACGVDKKDVWVYDQPTYSKNKAQYEKDFQKWLQAD